MAKANPLTFEQIYNFLLDPTAATELDPLCYLAEAGSLAYRWTPSEFIRARKVEAGRESIVIYRRSDGTEVDLPRAIAAASALVDGRDLVKGPHPLDLKFPESLPQGPIPGFDRMRTRGSIFDRGY